MGEQKRLRSMVDDYESSMIEKEAENALLVEKLEQLEQQIKGNLTQQNSRLSTSRFECPSDKKAIPLHIFIH